MQALPCLTDETVREALKVCFDPELPVNIVDLGLVYRVDVQPDVDAPGVEPRYCVAVDLTMRTPNEEREAMLLAQVRNRLAGLEQISRSVVRLVWDPEWSAERMSDAARRQLGLDRQAQQRLVSIKL